MISMATYPKDLKFPAVQEDLVDLQVPDQNHHAQDPALALLVLASLDLL
jgi:hypothetical protein